MKKTLVYDLPTRLFHFLFAGGFLVAFGIAKLLDDDSPYYPIHMLTGMGLTAIVLLRVLWGIFGSRFARFSSFALHPRDLLLYFKQLAQGKSERWLGHNPASSWAAIVMMVLALGLGVTGYWMTSGSGAKESLKEVHELLANAFLLVVLAHVAGVFLHLLRHRDGLALSMIHGSKAPVAEQAGIPRSHPWVAAIFLGLVGAFVFQLSTHYDRGRQTLDLWGTRLQLGESEGHADHETQEREDDD